MEDSRRQRSESSTADDVSHSTHIYIDKHYPQYKSVSNNRNRECECDYTSRNNFSTFCSFL